MAIGRSEAVGGLGVCGSVSDSDSVSVNECVCVVVLVLS